MLRNIKRMNQKTIHREHAKTVWKEILSNSEFQTKILRNFETFLKQHQKERIFAFYPIETELQILPIIKKIYKYIYIPLLTSNKEMQFALYKHLHDYIPIKKNRYGIFEPDIFRIRVDNQIVYPEKNDLVIIPSLGMNSNFARLGRGGGYYDRFFLKNSICQNSLKVSLIPESLLHLDFIHESHDLILDIVISENNIVYRES